jgi:MATE family multidrug resistance protein
MQSTTTLPNGESTTRELLRIAVPLVLSSGSLSLMHVVDRLFLTWYSKEALAASLPAGILNWTLVSIAMGTANYCNAFVAQYHGAGRPDRVASALWQGVYFSVAAGLLFIAMSPMAPMIFEWTAHDKVVAQLEAEYFSILCFDGLPFSASAALACFYSGRGQTRVIMWVNFAGMLFNAVFDYILIFGLGPIPSFGIRGAAAATVMANFLMLFCYLVLLGTTDEAKEYQIYRNWRFDRELFGRLLYYGLPSGLHWFLEVFCFALFIFIVGNMGTVQLAATNLAFNLNSLGFIPLLGLGTAVMTIVGQRVGEGRPDMAQKSVWAGAGVAVAYMSVFALACILLPNVVLFLHEWGAKLEGDTESARDFAAMQGTVVILLRFVAIYSIFDACAIVFGFAIRGAGDTVFPMVFSAVAGMFVMVIPTYVAFHYFDGGLFSAWTAATVYVCVVGVGNFLRFQTGLWKRMKVIETSTSTDTQAGPSLSHPREDVATAVIA